MNSNQVSVQQQLESETSWFLLGNYIAAFPNMAFLLRLSQVEFAFGSNRMTDLIALVLQNVFYPVSHENISSLIIMSSIT